MHVAVIGAGPAGLCAARHLTAPNSGFTCVVYEKTKCVGGTWVYTENTGKDKYGLPICSAMYKSLRTNLPTQTMEFSGFPFRNSKSFTTHAEVLKYLEDYTNHHGLKKYIQFLHHVKHVAPKDDKWQVTCVNLPKDEEVTEEFDAVMVCNGHNSVPHMGDFPNVGEFEGEVMHSHTYRIPEPFTNKTVLVCGGGPSGTDICYNLADFASKVYFSHRNQILMDSVPDNLVDVPAVKFVKNDHVIFEDGTASGRIDVILMCTGYQYSFPFLAPECDITLVDGKFIQPLYKHIFNVNHPTMGFFAMCFRSIVFPLLDYQVRFFLKTLTGEVKLASKEDMFADISKHIHLKEERGAPVRKYHELDGAKPYIDSLAEFAELELLPPVVYDIYKATINLRNYHLSNYREAIFETIDDSNFKMHFSTPNAKEILSHIPDKMV